MFELHAAAHHGAVQLTDVRSRACRPGRSVCCPRPDRATARRDPSAPSTATRSSRPASASPGPNGRPPPAGAWRGAQARSRRSSSISATRMAALASSRSRVGTSGNTLGEPAIELAGGGPVVQLAPDERRRRRQHHGRAVARPGDDQLVAEGPPRHAPVTDPAADRPLGHPPLRRPHSSRARYPHAVVATGRELHTTRPFAAGAFRFMVAASDPEDAALIDSLFRDLPSPPASDEPPAVFVVMRLDVDGETKWSVAGPRLEDEFAGSRMTVLTLPDGGGEHRRFGRRSRASASARRRGREGRAGRGGGRRAEHREDDDHRPPRDSEDGRSSRTRRCPWRRTETT